MFQLARVPRFQAPVFTLILAALCAVVANLCAPPAQAQEPQNGSEAESVLSLKEIETVLDTLSSELDAVEEGLPEVSLETGEVAEIRAALSRIAAENAALAEALPPRLEAVTLSLSTLGPPPGEDAPPEPEEIAEERSTLTKERDKIEGLMRRADVIAAQVRLTSRRLSARSRARFLDRILDRGPWPFSPVVWIDAQESLGKATDRLGDAIQNWFKARAQIGWHIAGVLILLSSVLILVVLTGPVRQAISREIVGRLSTDLSDKACRHTVALLRFANRLVMALLGMGVVFLAADAQGLITPTTMPVAIAIGEAVLLVFAGQGLAKAAFSVKMPELRPIPLTAQQARAASLAVTVMVSIVAADLVIRRGSDALDTSVNFAVAQSFVVAVIMALALLPLTRSSLWHNNDRYTEEINRKAQSIGAVLQWVAIALATGIGLAALLGYPALARYIVEKGTYFSVLIIVLFLLRGLIRSAALAQFAVSAGPSDPVATAPEEDTPGSFGSFWVGLSIDTVLLLLATPIVLLVVGAGWSDIVEIALWAVEDFSIGPIVVSPANILTAVILLGLALVATRLIQRVLETRIFPKTRLNIGERSAFSTLIGYLGALVGLGVAVGVAGLDFSNLAIVAGALSVGIGFGLQSIVNNFVSGIILLFERPVKVGDWIVTPSGEGIVRRISVRATEIQSFDRQAIIIPNAELITSTVSNWSHRDKIARLKIAIGVAYGSDIRQVEKVLLECAAENPKVAEWPAAYVYFANFGDSSVDLELRAFVQDNDITLSTKSELRFAIYEKFHEAGIEIPFPQRELRIHGSVEPVQVRPDKKEARPARPAPRLSGKSGAKPLDREPEAIRESDSEADDL